ANAVGGESRMGAVFGGMLLSGEHAANLVMKNLDK
ncbi:MAG: ribose 1,5-bisphosphate isomerase, partial [Methanomicrobiales archaeon]